MIARIRSQGILALIVLGYVLLAALYATRVPTWNAPDEPAHYNVVRSIAIDHRLPILQPGDYDQTLLDRLTHERFPPSESIATLRYESHQPPLYYALAAPVLLATQSAPLPTQVLALRLFTAAIGALFILAVYRLTRLIFPKSDVAALAAAAFVAFVPEHLFMSAAIDNDALAELMLCLTLIVVVEDLAERGKASNDPRAGIVVGLAALTKLVALVSAGLVAVGFIGAAWLAVDRREALRRVPARLVRAGIVAVALSGWWVVRNVVVYGLKDPFGLRRHAEVVAGQPLTDHLSLGLVRQMGLTLFHSFWGQFGWMGIPYSDRTYDVLASFSAVVALGVAVFAWRMLRSRGPVGPTPVAEPIYRAGIPLALSPLQTWALGLLVVEVVLVLLGVVFYNLRYLQPQGRYLFPTLPALAIFGVAGVAELFDARYVGLVLALAGLALYWLCIFSLFQVIGPAFAAPP